MAKIDEARMAERPEGVSERVWRAKIAYEAVQAEQEHVGRTDYTAREAADAVRRGEEPKRVRK